MSKKPYDLGERDKPTRGLAAHFRAKWMQADQRIRELEEEVGRLQDAIREHRDSFSKDMDEHDWTTEDEALWALIGDKTT